LWEEWVRETSPAPGSREGRPQSGPLPSVWKVG
jgi:hypothetical protein